MESFKKFQYIIYLFHEIDWSFIIFSGFVFKIQITQIKFWLVSKDFDYCKMKSFKKFQ